MSNVCTYMATNKSILFACNIHKELYFGREITGLI